MVKSLTQPDLRACRWHLEGHIRVHQVQIQDLVKGDPASESENCQCSGAE